MKKIVLFFVFSICIQITNGQFYKNLIQPNTISTSDFLGNSFNSTLNKKNKKLQLDNIITTSNGRPGNNTHYSYNEHGWLIEEIDSVFILSQKKWEIERYKFIRVEVGRIKQKIYSKWDTNKDSFQYFQRENFTYALNNKKATYVYEVFNNSKNEFKKSFKSEFFYDEKDNLITQIHSNWDDINMVFNKGERNIREFNNHNFQILHLTQRWNVNTNNWYDFSKNINIYTNNEQNLSAINLSFNETNLKLDSVSKVVQTYDLNQNLLTNISYKYDSVFKIWRYSDESRYDYVFDNDKNIISEVTQIRYSQSDKYSNIQKVVNGYDSKFNFISEIKYKWDKDKNDWLETTKIEWVRDLNYPLSDLVLPVDEYFNNYYFKYKLDKYAEFSWDKSSSKWGLTSLSELNYSNYTGLKVNVFRNENSIDVFPNPVIDKINFKIANYSNNLTIKIFNYSGVLEKTFSIENKDEVEISVLNKGVYFVLIYCGLDLIGVKKFVKTQ